MRNLKRVLSLAMASIMLVGMMVVGASAAGFPDSDKIQNTEAVENLVALNVINGKDDGSFDPEGIVTRAEMAKMICVAYNGGKDPNLTGGGLYPDTKGHWASGYIDYCTNMGFVSGDNKGNFNPNATVTGTEAAKMILVMLGYSATNEKFVNDANWDININTVAAQKDLYNGIAMNQSEGLTRDNAAQMLYNGIQAKMVQYTIVGIIDGNSVSQANDLSKTVLNSKFGVDKWIGTLDGNSETLSGLKDGQIQVKGMNEDDDTTKVSASDASFTYKLANNLEWIGEEVAVLYKDANSGVKGKPDDKDTIFGVYNTGSTTVYNITKDDMQSTSKDGKIKFGDKEYSLATPAADDVLVVTNYGATADVTASGGNDTALLASAKNAFDALDEISGDTIKYVANSDGKIYRAYVTEFEVGKVTAVTSEKVSISGLGTIKKEDNDIYSDVAKNDIVVYTKLYDAKAADAYVVVEEAETVTGEITAYKGTAANATEKVTVDGTQYTIAGKSLKSLTDNGVTSFSNNIGDDATLYLVGGMVVAIDLSTDSVKNYALVTANSGASSKLGDSFNPLKAELLYTDGVKSSVTLHKDSVVSKGGAKVDANAIPAGTLVRYSNVSDGVVKIVEVITTKHSVSDNGKVYNKDTKSLTIGNSSRSVAGNDDVLYVQTSADSSLSFKVYKLRDLNTIDNKTGDAVDVVYDLDNSGKVAAAYVNLKAKPSGATTTTIYGVVAANKGSVKIGDTYYVQLEVCTSDASADPVLVNIEGDTTALVVGDLVSFDKSNDDTYSSDTGMKITSDNTMVAVKEYSENDKILSYYTATEWNVADKVWDGDKSTLATRALDDDAVIVYINAEDKGAGDDIGVNGFDVTTGAKNAIIVTDGAAADAAILAIFIESTGNVNADGSALPTQP